MGFRSVSVDLSRQFQSGDPPDVRTRPYIEILTLDLSRRDSVAAGATQDVLLYAPVGWVCEVMAMRLTAPAPAGATSGTHLWGLRPLNAFTALEGENAYNAALRFLYSYFSTASAARPPGDAAQGNAMRALRAGPYNPLAISYLNLTNAAQGGTRPINLAIRRIKAV